MVKFTRRQREKLRDLGWEKHFSCKDQDVVKLGRGKYTKQFGKVWVSLLIRDGYITQVQTSLLCQTSDLDFADSLNDDLRDGLREVRYLQLF